MMIPWNGEEMLDPRLRPHESVWLIWNDFQASCYWYQCRRCQEKFYVTHEFMDSIERERNKNLEQTLEEFVNDLHDKRIEKLASGIH